MDDMSMDHEERQSISTTDPNCYSRSSVHGHISVPVSDKPMEQAFTENSKHSPMCPNHCIQGCSKHALPEQQHMEENTEPFKVLSNCSIDGIAEFMNTFRQTMMSYLPAMHDLQSIRQALHSANEKDTYKNLKLETEDLRKMVDNYKAKLTSQANAVDSMKTTLTQMQQERQNHEKVSTENTQLKENLNATTEKLNATTNMYKDLKDANANLEKELLEHKNHCKINTRTVETQKQEIKELNEKMVQIKEAYQRQINAREKELLDTKSRLTKLLGDSLTENNSDIADLSDKNRPTKLAEKYQELYDNQWTDAFIAVEKYFCDGSEQFHIQTLVNILLTVKKFCEEQHKMQERELVFALCRTNNPKNPLPNHIRQHFKLFQKNVGEEAIEPLYEKFMESLKSDKTAFSKFILTVPLYVKECVALCWLMTIQDPPVVFDGKQQEPYKSDTYRAYTKSGDKIAYIVWPALYLRQDGPVIMKGVAQYYKSNVDQTTDENSSAASNNLITPRKETSTTNEPSSITAVTTRNIGQFRNNDDNMYLKTIVKPYTQVITDTHIYTAKEGQGQHDSNTTNEDVGNTSNSSHFQIEQRQDIDGTSTDTGNQQYQARDAYYPGYDQPQLGNQQYQARDAYYPGYDQSQLGNQQYQARRAYYPGYDQPQSGQRNLRGIPNIIYPQTSTFILHGQQINGSTSLRAHNSHDFKP